MSFGNGLQAGPRVAAPAAPAWPTLTPTRLEVLLIDEPVARPVRTSFGTMHTRPGLLLRVTDDTGAQGLGEVWCNFPPGGARYKATLATRLLAPELLGRPLAAPGQAWPQLEARFAVLALQCADFGALAQVLAGLDQALWDLFCKRLGQPFWQALGGQPHVAVYASGIGPQRIGPTIAEQAAAGHCRFKIKLGFGDDADQAHLDEAQAALPAGAALAVDVNQGWTFEQARHWLPRLAERGIVWCEEPLRADAPWSQWRRLAAAAPGLRLAGGENLMGADRFAAAVEKGALSVLQPDLGKWGGISANLALARQLAARAAPTPAAPEPWLCPHWLAGGVGLMASLQFKAAIGGAGWVEMDANPNPQRSEAFAQALVVREGWVQLPAQPGLIPALSPRLDAQASWTDDVPA